MTLPRATLLQLAEAGRLGLLAGDVVQAVGWAVLDHLAEDPDDAEATAAFEALDPLAWADRYDPPPRLETMLRGIEGAS